MSRLRRLSGQEVAAILQRFGFEFQKQRGSHAKLKRLVPGGKQVLTVPMHRELDTRFIPEADLAPHVYTE